MHAGDDEGREPASLSAARRAKQRRQHNNNAVPDFDHEFPASSSRRALDLSEEEDDDDDEDDHATAPRSRDEGRKRGRSRQSHDLPQQQHRKRRKNGPSPPGSPEPSPPPPPPQHAASVRQPKGCWLCTFANCKMAKHVSTFVSTNAGTMDPAIMADQIKREVLKEYPLARGIGRRHVLRHIREHVLIPGVCVCVCVCVCVRVCAHHCIFDFFVFNYHLDLPGVRLASIVRSLITLAETLRCTLQQVDDETGDLVVDIRNTELYLKVVTQISNVYKLDGTKLLFQNGVAPPTTRPPPQPSSAPAPPIVSSHRAVVVPLQPQ